MFEGFTRTKQSVVAEADMISVPWAESSTV